MSADSVSGQLRNRVEDAYHLAKQALDRISNVETRQDTAQDDRDDMRNELADLRSEIERIDDRTDLVQHVTKRANGSVDEHAATFIQILHNEATGRGERDTKDYAAAELDAQEAVKTLGGGMDYRNMYRRFDRAVELVDDDDVLAVKEEPRYADENTRLVLNLEAGDLPSSVAGYTITEDDD